LIVEDMADDAELMILRLSGEGFLFDWQRVSNEQDYLAALTHRPDLILADWSLPHFSGLRALELLRERSLDIPFIIVSGSIGEETAVDAVRQGAYDYILKDRPGRLGQAIRHALEDKRLRVERKRAVEVLRESEERFRQVSLSMMDIAYSCVQQPDGHYVIDWIAGSAEALLGYPVEEIHFFGCWGRLVTDEDRSLFERSVTGLAPGDSCECELRLRKKDGSLVWMVSYARCVLSPEDPDHPRLYGALVDITERKLVEQKAQQDRRNLQATMAALSVGMLVFDGDLNITYANPAAEVLCATTLADLVDRRCGNFIQCVNRHDDPQGCGTGQDCLKCPIHSALAAVLRGGADKTQGESMLSVERQSASLWVKFVVNSMEFDQRRFAVLTLDDITERKQAEDAVKESKKQFQELFDDAPVGYHEFDSQGRITKVNRTESEMLGYSIDEMLGQPVWKFIEEEELSRQSVLNKLAGLQPEGRGLERTYRRKEGSTFPALIEDRLFRNPEGKIIGIRSTIQDITERKRAEQENASLQDQLRQSQKVEAIGQLAGGVAHDFNNLLTIIQGNSQLCLMDLQEGDTLRANIEEIRDAAKRAADLTRQLLAFSRKQILEMRVLDLNQVLQGLDKMLRRVIGEDIELTMLLPESIWKVKVDPGQIEQVIMNISVNARDAMIEGGKLTIETANVELDEEYAKWHIAVQPGRYVMLAVSDNGVGMTPEVRAKVFEPFFTTKEKGKGTGLGLSMVYGIVKQCGGNIWVYSEPGQGTTIKIYLPQVDEPLEELKEEVVKEISQGHETILVVEDEKPVLKLTVRALKRQGYQVLEAPDGGKAIILSEEFKEPIHLILTDVVMPGMSGRKLADRLTDIHPEIKVLYMSGYTDNAILHHGILEPGINFVQKPFTVEGLARKVREVLDK
jgi:two-component system, cell cycle sensor histidine kinase and response regulator CckA